MFYDILFQKINSKINKQTNKKPIRFNGKIFKKKIL